MGRTDPTHLVVGHLAKSHGTRGEIFVHPLTDHPEQAFQPGVVLSLGNPKDDEPNPDLPPLRIEASRPHQRGYLVTFGGVEDRDAADLLRGRYVFRHLDELEPLAEGELFYHQLLGLTVVTTDDQVVGEVVEVFEVGPTDLLEVRGARGTIMIPYRPEIIIGIDLDESMMIVDPPDGLLEVQE